MRQQDIKLGDYFTDGDTTVMVIAYGDDNDMLVEVVDGYMDEDNQEFHLRFYIPYIHIHKYGWEFVGGYYR